MEPPTAIEKQRQIEWDEQSQHKEGYTLICMGSQIRLGLWDDQVAPLTPTNKRLNMTKRLMKMMMMMMM